MVKIINSFEEESALIKRKSLIHKLAASIFGDRVGSIEDSNLYDSIEIYSKYKIARIASINYAGNVITVNKEEDYQNCLKLAEECEKMLKEEITLRVEYKY